MSLNNLLASQKQPLDKSEIALEAGQCYISQGMVQYNTNGEQPPTSNQNLLLWILFCLQLLWSQSY